MNTNKKSIFLIDVLIAAWLVFFVIRITLQATISFYFFLPLSFSLFCYCLGRSVNSIQSVKKIVTIVLFTVAAVCLFYLYYDIFIFQAPNFVSANSSIMAIALAIATTVCFAVLKKQKEHFLRVLLGVSACIFIYLLFLLQSRTAVIALITGALFVYYPRFKKWFSQSRVLFIISAILILVTLSLALLVKLDSSAGRWFIWKNSLQLGQQNWLAGTGIPLFNPAYNHLQAEYFSLHSLYQKEAMLANDGYYAFNEWLHIGVEQGIVGFILFLLLTFILLKTCIRHIENENNFAGAALIAVFIACVFSYPLHNWLIVSIALFFAGIIARLSPLTWRMKTPGWLKTTGLILLVCTTGIMGYFHVNAITKFTRARELEKEGFRTEAYKLATKQATALKSDPSFTLFYLRLLYETGRLQQAIQWFDTFHVFHCNQKAHAIIGKCYAETGEIQLAEEHLRMSLYITPHLLQSRMDLLNFYDQKGDTVNAKYWAHEIICYPAKIATNKAWLLKQQAEKYLKSH